MTKFYIELKSTTIAHAIVEAESKEAAYQIAHAADLNDLTKETEAYDLWELYELTEEESEEFDIARLKQTATGYEIL